MAVPMCGTALEGVSREPPIVLTARGVAELTRN
jgi:hypothetical protein